MKKIAIIGSGGAGKSTFARQLYEKLSIDVFHLDALLWKPNWVESSKDEQILIQKQLVEKDSWIIDGNYGGTLDIRLNAADTIIFLDIHRIICTYRALKRIRQYRNKTRADMAIGCDEKFDIDFFKWIWSYPNTGKPAVLNLLHGIYKEKQVIILRSPKEVRAFLERL